VPWRLTVRAGSQFDRARFDELAGALDELERRGRDVAQSQQGRPVDAKFRRFEPVQQVAARLEVAGPQLLLPRVRAGVDVRGDGSTEAFLGRVRRVVVVERDGEDAYTALRRALKGN
jgi:uncharacterized metal-binding protein YceD (DUF177 family)